MDKMLSKWEMELGASDRVNTPCLMHDTLLRHIDVKMTDNYHGTNMMLIQNLIKYTWFRLPDVTR